MSVAFWRSGSVLVLILALLPLTPRSPAVTLAQAARNCAVSVVSVSIGSGGGRNADNPGIVLGDPEGTRAPFLSLGRGGTLIVQVGGDGVSADGTPASDLFVYESGTQAEFVFVSVSTDGATYIPVGATGSQASGIDLDAVGFAPGTSYSYVQIQDDPNQGSHTGPETGGADIDAVCGFNTANRPPLASNDVASFAVGDPYVSDSVLANDRDPDGNPLTIESFTQPDGEIGIVTLDGTGRATFVPTDSDFAGDVVFTYTVIDGQGGRAVATVTLTIAGASASPSAVSSMSDSPPASPSDQASDSAAPSESPSAPASDGASVSGSASPSTEPSVSEAPSEAPSPSDLASGMPSDEPSASDLASESPSGVPSAPASLDPSIAPSAEPSIDLSVEPSVTEEPSPGGSVPPVASAIVFDGAVELPLDGDLAGDLTSLVENPEGTALVFSLIESPVNGDLMVNPGGPFTYVPPSGFTGFDAFTIAVTVDGGEPASASVVLTVSADCTDGVVSDPVSGTPVATDAVVVDLRPCAALERTGPGVIVSGPDVQPEPTVPVDPGSGGNGGGGGGVDNGASGGDGPTGGGSVDGGAGGGAGVPEAVGSAVGLPNTGSGPGGNGFSPLAGLLLAIAIVLGLVATVRRRLA